MDSLTDFLGVPWWAAIPVAFVPAALNWWWSRTLIAAGETATLPERYLAVAQRVSRVTVLSAIVIGVLAGWQAVWIFAIAFVASTCSAYGTRRVLFGETWPLHQYLWWRVRVLVGFAGFWLFVVIAPSIVASVSPAPRLWIAGALAAVALTWQYRHGRLLLFVLGASRLDRPDLNERFQQVFDRSTAATPLLWRAGVSGGVIANAFALPQLDRSGIIFFDTLLERLSPEEITAILAHEVAHLEYYDRRRLLRSYAVTLPLIVLLIVGAAFVDVVIAGAGSWVPAFISIAVLAGLWLRARRMQAHETDADIRAVDLCGNSEALISGLTAIHAINYIPRRWSSQMEEHATHPSLARRIRAIRRHANPSDTPGSIERTVVASTEVGRFAVIDSDRIAFVWADGTETPDTIIIRARRAEMVAYSELRELRLATSGANTLRLIATDQQARRWSLSIRASDAERVQAALDLVDHMVVAPPRSSTLDVGRRIGTFIVLLVAAVFNALIPIVMPALLALRRPARPTMMALTVALTVSSLLSASDAVVSVTRVFVLAVLALVTLWQARQSARQEAEPQSAGWLRIERAALSLPLGIGLLIIAADTHSLFGLHAAVRDRSWIAATVMALAAYLFLSTDRASRRLGSIAAVVAVVMIMIGSPWFVVGAVGDPLVASMPSLTQRRVPLTSVSRQSVKGDFDTAWLAADGQSFLLRAYEDDESEDAALKPRRYLAGGFNGWLRPLEAWTAAQIDGERLLAVDRQRGASRLRVEDLRTGELLWSLPLAIDVDTVEATPGGRWRALSRRGTQFTRVDGEVGTSQTRETHWTIAADRGSYVLDPRIDDGSVALGVATEWKAPIAPWLGTTWQGSSTLLSATTARATDIARSQLSVDCLAPPVGIKGYICISFDGRWSRLWRIDPSTGGLIPAGQTPGSLWGTWQRTGNQIGTTSEGHPAVIALDSGTIGLLDIDRNGCGVGFDNFAFAKDLVLVTCMRDGSTDLNLYSMPASR